MKIKPLRVIVVNAGGSPPVVAAKVKEGAGNFGFNAASEEYGDMEAMGILDPTKVVRTALQNSSLNRRPDDHHRGHGLRAAGEEAAASGKRNAGLGYVAGDSVRQQSGLRQPISKLQPVLYFRTSSEHWVFI